jgi:uncharacterized membrane protein YdjX (TVP38/TMEM64 family)
MTVLIRLLPVGSNLLTNLAAGISSIRSKHFFSGTLLGYLPQTLVFALVGSGVHIAPALKLALAIGLFRHGQSLDDQIDAALDETEPSSHEPAPKS